MPRRPRHRCWRNGATSSGRHVPRWSSTRDSSSLRPGSSSAAGGGPDVAVSGPGRTGRSISAAAWFIILSSPTRAGTRASRRTLTLAPVPVVPAATGASEACSGRRTARCLRTPASDCSCSYTARISSAGKPPGGHPMGERLERPRIETPGRQDARGTARAPPPPGRERARQPARRRPPRPGRRPATGAEARPLRPSSSSSVSQSSR